ncbi:Uncharacterised protein [Mycobacterium tuberculosis]|nr:Uncharacterised protein [Mycobacterium tuberculosis]
MITAQLGVDQRLGELDIEHVTGPSYQTAADGVLSVGG